MKKLLVLGLSGLLTACGGEGRPEATTADSGDFCAVAMAAVEAYQAEARASHPTPDDERYGGTAVVGYPFELTSGMNSAVTNDYGSRQVQNFANLMTLVAYDESLYPTPYLASSWELTDDSTALVFHIRRDVVWHDGEPTDAHDVAFTYGLVTNPETGFPNVGYFDFYGAMEVVDDFTVRVELRPHADFLDAWRALAILPEHLLGGVSPAEIAQHPFGSQCPVGNGPFVFREHLPQDRWVFDANPAFPSDLGGRPFLDRLVQRVIPDQTTLQTELLTGGVDVFVEMRPDQVDRVADAGLAIRRFPHRQVAFVAWNSRRPQLADRRVRRALTLAIDRHELVEAIVMGYGVVANTTLPPFHWAFDESIVPDLRSDPAEARRLLEEAGWADADGDGIREDRNGVPLAITIKYNTGNQQRQEIAEILQARLGAVGVDVSTEVVEPATLGAQAFDPEVRDFDALVFGWIHDFRVDDRDLFHSQRIDGPYALAGTDNPELDQVLDTLPLVADRAVAKPLWDEYQRLQLEEHPFTLLYFSERIAGVSNRMRDVTMDVRGDWVGIRGWWIDPTGR